jgi:hypothetical protein
MKIFSISKEEEGCFYTTCHSARWQLEPRVVSPNQSGITTIPINEVTFNHTSTKYFKYLNQKNTRAGNILHLFC